MASKSVRAVDELVEEGEVEAALDGIEGGGVDTVSEDICGGRGEGIVLFLDTCDDGEAVCEPVNAEMTVIGGTPGGRITGTGRSGFKGE